MTNSDGYIKSSYPGNEPDELGFIGVDPQFAQGATDAYLPGAAQGQNGSSPDSVEDAPEPDEVEEEAADVPAPATPAARTSTPSTPGTPVAPSSSTK